MIASEALYVLLSYTLCPMHTFFLFFFFFGGTGV
jgi:hypothetical protein